MAKLGMTVLLCVSVLLCAFGTSVYVFANESNSHEVEAGVWRREKRSTLDELMEYLKTNTTFDCADMIKRGIDDLNKGGTNACDLHNPDSGTKEELNLPPELAEVFLYHYSRCGVEETAQLTELNQLFREKCHPKKPATAATQATRATQKGQAYITVVGTQAEAANGSAKRLSDPSVMPAIVLTMINLLAQFLMF